MSIPITHLSVSTKPMMFSAEDLHLARCIGVVHIGTVTIKEKESSLVRLTWEMPHDLRSFNPQRPEELRPKEISREYTASLYGKSWLKKHLVGWFGEEKCTELFMHSFDPYEVLGEACILDIRHKVSNSNTWYEEIEEVSSADGMEVPMQVNDSKVLTYENWDQEVFDSLPVFVRNKMLGSKEYIKMFGIRRPYPTKGE